MNQNDNHEFIERELSQSEVQDRRYNLEEFLDAKDRQEHLIDNLKADIKQETLEQKRLEKRIFNIRSEIRSGKVLELRPKRQQEIPFEPDGPTLADASGEPVADPREKPARKPRSRKLT